VLATSEMLKKLYNDVLFSRYVEGELLYYEAKMARKVGDIPLSWQKLKDAQEYSNILFKDQAPK
jgi:hypothetical protein